MITFLQIQDIDKFFKMVDSCIGRILLKSSEGLVANIRKYFRNSVYLMDSSCKSSLKQKP